MTRVVARRQGRLALSIVALVLGLALPGRAAPQDQDKSGRRAAGDRAEVGHVAVEPGTLDALAPVAPATHVVQSAECEALEGSALPAPDWYAARCGGGAVPQLLAPPVDTSFIPGDPTFFCALFSPNGTLSRRLLTAPLPTSTYTNVGPCSTAPASIFALDFDNAASVLWAIDSTCGASCTGTTYGTINQATGAFTAVGNITGAPAGANFAGLRFDPTSSTVYMMVLTPAGQSQLMTLNLATGAATAIGPVFAGLIIDIAISNAGVIYGHDIGLDRIVTIDKVTGAVTAVGPTGIDANFAQGMDFDASTNTLYLFAITIPGNVGRIGSVNLATGAFTQLSQNTEELEGAIKVAGGAPPAFFDEVEPNDTTAAAQVLTTNPVRIRGDLYRAPFVLGQTDVDVFKFTAAAGDRLFAAVITSGSSGSTDPTMEILDSNGAIIETDLNDGSFSASASNVGGTVLTTAGTYYVLLRQVSIAGPTLSGTVRPYDLYVRVLSGTPTSEVEPNNNGGTPNPLPANGWVSGVIDPVGDSDTFSLTANAGDTIVVIQDLDPERDTPDWNGRTGIGIFNNNFLVTSDAGTGDAQPSEAIAMTVKTTGTYVIYVDSQLVGGGGPTATYHLSVFVIPAKVRTCTTYTGTGGAITDLGTTDFTIAVPDVKTVDYLRVSLNATHTLLTDLDVTLLGTDGNEMVLFDDPPNTAGAGAPQFNTILEYEAALPIALFGINSGMVYQPESLAGRLDFFKGMPAQGTWTLRVRDDTTANTGTVNSWSIDVCEAPPRPACAVPGPQEITVFSTDFEAGDAGFTHSGTADEWERGLPTFPPITTAHSGVNAWKTDLDNTYELSSNQNLLSPALNLTSVTGRITLSWWQKYNIESASFDSFWVEVRPVGNPAAAKRYFNWMGATMSRSVGSPAVTIQQAAGWARVQADISSFAGQMVEVVFHFDSDPSVVLTGVAIDDVLVTACTAVVGQSIANAAITKTDNQATYFPGQQITYVIVASNAGPSAITGGNVVDNFPADFTGATWSCVASAGSACNGASGTGDINASVNLLTGGNATFTVTGTVSLAATGNLVNTASIAVPSGTVDPDLSNNSATDTDTFLAISAAPEALAVDTGGNGVYEPNETVVVAPTWRNTGAGAIALTGALTNHTGPSGPTYTIPDGAASYGTIAVGATASCTASGNCYSVANTATARPATHWDSTALETVNPTAATKTWTLHVGNSFSDVPPSNGFYRFIETILHNGITGGCTGTTYCPTASTAREQMAVFVLVAKEGVGYLPPACVAGAEMFNDVPATSPFCRWIEELARRGVVGGCGGGAYCALNPAAREQMAVFVLRTFVPTFNPPNCTAGSEMFTDVPASSPFCKWIEELVRRGVVTGCGGGIYCPTAAVSREQMSVFLTVTFGLRLYGL